jgi:ABC-type nitrate/sulfonate/bicarbonate transport system permease component
MRFLRLSIPVVAFLAAWEVASRSGAVSPVLFPPPSRVFATLFSLTASGQLITDALASYRRLIVGLSFGSAVGVLVGLFTGRVKRIADALVPLIHLFRPLPPVAIIPLIIVWFGIGEPAKYFSIAFAVFFPVWLNTHLGAQQIPEKIMWCASTLTRSRLRKLRSVVFPAALPFIVAGLRVGLALSFTMVFVSELMGSSEGIGYEIHISQLAYRIDRMMASLALLGASGFLADFLFTKGIGLLSEKCN